MNIIIQGRHLDITPALREYAESKVRKFERFFPAITEAIITLSVEKYRQKAEVILHANGTIIKAESATQEIYSAIDEVIDKIERRIKKLKEKTHAHRKSKEMPSSFLTEKVTEEEADIKTIETEPLQTKPMSPEEAAMEMELMNMNFFVFTNAESGDINILYRKKNGNYGLIQPMKG